MHPRAKATPVNQSPAGPAPVPQDGPPMPPPMPDPNGVGPRLKEALSDEDREALADIQFRVKAAHREAQRKEFEAQSIAMEYDEKIEELQRKYKIF